MQRIVFLHHSTGHSIWVGDTNRYIFRLTRKGSVQRYFEEYNREHGTDYRITDLLFPKKYPYGWKNYPFDYYNIWVKNAGSLPYMEEPTLEILTADYDVIIFKHCYPIGKILPDTGSPDINSEEKRLENYKVQYNALKEKLHSFPQTRFVIWTPPASVRGQVTPDEAIRTFEFYRWMVNEWKEEGDNIHIWDFYNLETEGSLYLPAKNALSPDNSHPGPAFSERLVPLFSQFIIDVIESVPAKYEKEWIF